MAIREFAQGEIIYEAGQKLDALYMIMRGTASAFYAGGRHMLKTGDVIGLCEVNDGSINTINSATCGISGNKGTITLQN